MSESAASESGSNILFQDEDVCILKPDSQTGVIIFTISRSANICTEGLFSYNKLREVHPELGLGERTRTNDDHNNYIFFRAPYNSDTSTFESSFNGKPPQSMLYGNDAIATIRVDPTKTYVYYSEARDLGSYENIKNTRMLLSKFLSKISNHPFYNESFLENFFNNRVSENVKKSGVGVPWRMFEIVVKRPHIPPEWFVSCHTYAAKGGMKNERQSSMVRKSRTRKQRGGDGMGQPLKYTDASHQEPSVDAGFNRQGIEPPYLIRPALAAIPMRGGTQVLSPMAFRDAYHTDPAAPTGQPLTDLKLPATLRQGLNLGPMNGGRHRRSSSRGGFYPSIMGGVVANAPLLAPLAARQGMRLLEEYRRTNRRTRRKSRKSNRRKNSGRRA
jgi:hypothetical protein